MSRSLSSEYVEMQSNGCQTELNEIVPQLNSPNSIEIDNTKDSKRSRTEMHVKIVMKFKN